MAIMVKETKLLSKSQIPPQRIDRGTLPVSIFQCNRPPILLLVTILFLIGYLKYKWYLFLP